MQMKAIVLAVHVHVELTKEDVFNGHMENGSVRIVDVDD